jgi:hypothetical protein
VYGDNWEENEDKFLIKIGDNEKRENQKKKNH